MRAVILANQCGFVGDFLTIYATNLAQYSAFRCISGLAATANYYLMFILGKHCVSIAWVLIRKPHHPLSLALPLSAWVPGAKTKEFGYQCHTRILLLSGWPGGALAVGFSRQLADLLNIFGIATADCCPLLFRGAGERAVADNAEQCRGCNCSAKAHSALQWPPGSSCWLWGLPPALRPQAQAGQSAAEGKVDRSAANSTSTQDIADCHLHLVSTVLYSC